MTSGAGSGPIRLLLTVAAIAGTLAGWGTLARRAPHTPAPAPLAAPVAAPVDDDEVILTPALDTTPTPALDTTSSASGRRRR